MPKRLRLSVTPHVKRCRMRTPAAGLVLTLGGAAVLFAAFAYWSNSREQLIAPGDSVTIQFSKDAFVRCLANPDTTGVVLTVQDSGLTIEETTANLSAVHQTAQGAQQCREVGFRQEPKGKRRYFIPKTAVVRVIRTSQPSGASANAA